MNDPARPNRCQHVKQSLQCNNDVVPGYNTCRNHMTHTQLRQHDERQYNLGKLNSRVDHFSAHEQVKSLRDEIGIARVLVEERLKLINTDADLIASTPSVNALLLTIERLVKTCHTMEQSLGDLLSRAVVLNLGKRIGEVIAEELESLPGYEGVADRLIEKLIPVLTTNQAVEL